MSLPLLLQMGFTGLVFVALLRRRITEKVMPLKWMTLVFFLAFIRTLVQLIQNPGDHDVPPNQDLQLIVFAMSILVFYLFLELTLREEPHPFRVAIVIFFTGAFLGMFGMAILSQETSNPSYWPFARDIAFYELPFDLMQFSIWIVGMYAFGKMAYLATEPQVKYLSLGVMTSMLLFMISAVIEISEHFTNEQYSSTVTTIPAFFVIFLVYITAPWFAFSSPVRVYRMIIIHKTGPPIVSLKVDPKYQIVETHSAEMIAGVATSLNNILKELTISDEANMEMTKMSHTTYMFDSAPNILALLEVEKPTYILKSALGAFTREFSSKFEKELEEFEGDVSEFLDYREMIGNYFPFITDIEHVEN